MCGASPQGRDPRELAREAQPALDQVQLEAAEVVSCRRVRRAPQERGEAPAAVDVASLRMAPLLAGSHILDHTPTQRADGGISAHGELLLSEVANTSSSSGRGSPPRYNRALNSLPTPPTAPPRSGYRGSDLVLCPLPVVRGPRRDRRKKRKPDIRSRFLRKVGRRIKLLLFLVHVVGLPEQG